MSIQQLEGLCIGQRLRKALKAPAIALPSPWGTALCLPTTGAAWESWQVKPCSPRPVLPSLTFLQKGSNTDMLRLSCKSSFTPSVQQQGGQL